MILRLFLFAVALAIFALAVHPDDAPILLGIGVAIGFFVCAAALGRARPWSDLLAWGATVGMFSFLTPPTDLDVAHLLLLGAFFAAVVWSLHVPTRTSPPVKVGRAFGFWFPALAGFCVLVSWPLLPRVGHEPALLDPITPAGITFRALVFLFLSAATSISLVLIRQALSSTAKAPVAPIHDGGETRTDGGLS